MDTDETYLDTSYYVRLAGETPPVFVQEYYQSRINDPDDTLVDHDPDPFRDHHVLNEDVPIDGQVAFYYPDRLSPDVDKGAWSFAFPFRDYRKDGAPWAAFPEKPKWKRHPVWKWTNPEQDPHEHLTLKPSLGVGEPLSFHCWIRDGEIEWL
jgi:hypothetical protein